MKAVMLDDLAEFVEWASDKKWYGFGDYFGEDRRTSKADYFEEPELRYRGPNRRHYRMEQSADHLTLTFYGWGRLFQRYIKRGRA